MNTAGLEWFGPPERNTLSPLCAVLLKTEELELSSVCVYVCPLCTAGASLLYLKGGAYTAVGSPIGGPNDVVQNNVLFIYYGVAGEGDLSPGFPCCSWNPPFSMSKCCLVETAPGVASGVACHVAERAV